MLSQSVDFGKSGEALRQSGGLTARGAENGQHSLTKLPQIITSTMNPSPTRNYGSMIEKNVPITGTSLAQIRQAANREVRQLRHSTHVPKGTYKLSIEQSVRSQKKNDDNWGIKGYNAINFTHLDKPQVFSIAKPAKVQTDYISQVIKRQKDLPGPGNYNREQVDHLGKNPKFYISKDKGGSFVDDLIRADKGKPGVGKYDASPKKPKVLGTYTQNESNIGMISEAVYKGMQTPHSYEMVPFDKFKTKYRTARIYKPKTDKPDNRLKKDDSPNPHTYRPEGGLELTSKKVKNYKFSKMPKSSFTDIEIKKRKKSPGVGSYNIESADKIMTKGLSRGYK